MRYDPSRWADDHERALYGASRELRPYNLEPAEWDAAMSEIVTGPGDPDDVSHPFRVGDHVQSELSGRTGVVKRFTRAVVLVAYDDARTNVDHAEAPEAWVPHGVLRKVGAA